MIQSNKKNYTNQIQKNTPVLTPTSSSTTPDVESKYLTAAEAKLTRQHKEANDVAPYALNHTSTFDGILKSSNCVPQIAERIVLSKKHAQQNTAILEKPNSKRDAMRMPKLDEDNMHMDNHDDDKADATVNHAVSQITQRVENSKISTKQDQQSKENVDTAENNTKENNTKRHGMRMPKLDI